MSLRRLLVPLDGSELSASVLPIARTFGSRAGTALRLVTVQPGNAELSSASAAASYLDTIAADLRAEGIVVDTNVCTGQPGKAIVTCAVECRADAIVMATHGRSGLRRTLSGSVVDDVVQHSRVPVLLLHPAAPRPAGLQTILVPLDGSARAAAALSVATPLTQTTRARLILARVDVPFPLWLYDPTLGLDTGPMLDSSWMEEDRQAAADYAERFAARLRCIGLDVTGVGLSGLPAPALVKFAHDHEVDLIVMGTHARTGPLRTVLGSVADEVVRTSGTPVLLVRQPAHPPAEVQSTSRDFVHDPGTRLGRARLTANKQTHPLAFERSDADLAHAVCHALECDPLLPDVDILSTVSHGVVTLEGTVPTRLARDAAERTAGRVIGVKHVVNALHASASRRFRRDE